MGDVIKRQASRFPGRAKPRAEDGA